ncbi:uncharacterized protein LOC119725958 isoform X2 [Patiria miniata]|uniref:Uncharacterized protein n=1 Tax=Patiria miniata TaxID=46514 RepID=A0A913ZQV1_PATMI|nr:uncharacterized protein LOC119725958 isoform X2 [Patiria miniata]
MPRKTAQQLDAYIKATAVVYDHSNTKLISRKTKVKPRRKQAFLSVLHYGKTSSDDCCAKRRSSKRRISRQLSHAGKQKLQIFVRTPLLHTPKTLCFRLDPGTSISSLKERIQTKIGVEARYQRLYFRRNFQLCDLLTLEDNGIEKDENISLRLSFDGLLGGGPKERAQFDQFLWDIATKIESAWKEVAKNLEFEEADIGEIQAKNEDDSKEQGKAMLFTWWSKQKKSREASQKLREALEASGLADLALKVPDLGNRGSDNFATSAAAAADHKTSKQEEQEVTEMIAVEKTLSDRTRMEQETGKPDMSQPETRPVGEFKDPSSKPPSAASLDQLVLGERQIGAQHGQVEQQLVDVTVSTSSERMIDSAELQSCSEEKHMTRTRATPELEQGDDSHIHSPKHLATIPPGQRLHESVEYVRITQPLTTLAVEEMEQNNRHAMSSPEQERLRQETGGPTGHQSQKQQLAGGTNLVSPEQMKHSQVSSSNSESLASSAPQRSTSSVSAVQKYGSNGSKQVSVDLNVGGSYDPIFLAPVTNTTVNFIQNVNVTGKSPEFPKVSIETDVTRQGCKDSGMTDILWTAMTNLCKTHGSDYLLEQVSACLKPYGIELEQVKSGSVTFVVRILSREGLNKLWSMYTTGELARKLTEIILTDELITEDKSDLAIQATVLQSDYEQACRFFDNLERDQQKDEEDSSGMAEVHHTQLNESSTTTSAYSGDPAEHAADRCNEKLKTLFMTTEEEDSSEMTEVQLTQPGESSTATLSSSSDPAELAAVRCKEKMKTLYMTTGTYSQMVKWVDGDTKKILMPKLTLVEAGDETEKMVISYEDIFLQKTPEGDPIKLAVLTGPDDEQKSIILENIAYDWATGSSPTLQNFEIVIVLPTQTIDQESDLQIAVTEKELHLVDLIYAQLLGQDTYIDRGDLKSFIDTNPHKVLVLWDGFDILPYTYSIGNTTKVDTCLELLNRMATKGIRILVTTRPSNIQTFMSKSMDQEPVTHIVFDNPGQAEDLIDRIKSSDVLSDWAKSLNLMPLLCSLSRHSSLPDTMSHLYSRAMTYIFTRQTDMSQDELSRVLIALCKTALEGLVSLQQRFTFQEEEFEDEALEKALDAGLLIRQRVPIGQKFVNDCIQFSHKTMQAFCAAKYCQSLSDEEFQKLLDQIDDPCNIQYLLRFCCGDNKQCCRQILLMLHRKNTKGKEEKELALQCYFESQATHVISEDVIKSWLTGCGSLSISDHTLKSRMWLLQHVADQTQLTGYLAKIHDITFAGCDLSRVAKVVASRLTTMTNLSSLCLDKCRLAGYQFDDILLSLQRAGNLTHLTLSGTGLGGTAKHWAFKLQGLKSLQALSFTSCNLNAEDIPHIASSVGKMPNLANLNLSSNKVLGGNAGTWAASLQTKTHLFRVQPYDSGMQLIIGWLSLTSEDFASILESFSNRRDLVSLKLDGIHGAGGSAGIWTIPLQNLTGIRELGLRNCSLQSTDIKHLAAALGQMPNLAVLNLKGNYDLGGMMTSQTWAASLPLMIHLKKLDMTDCNMGDDHWGMSYNLKYIAKSVSVMGNLVHFDFSGELGEMRVQPCGNGIQLIIKGFSLTGKDMADILQSFSNRRDLVSLIVRDICGSANIWTPPLQNITHLKELRLTHCSLQSTDIEPLAAAVSRMPTVESLSLVGSCSLSGSAKTWAPSLKQIKHVSSLKFGGCALTEEDKKHISEAWGSGVDFRVS